MCGAQWAHWVQRWDVFRSEVGVNGRGVCEWWERHCFIGGASKLGHHLQATFRGNCQPLYLMSEDAPTCAKSRIATGSAVVW